MPGLDQAGEGEHRKHEVQDAVACLYEDHEFSPVDTVREDAAAQGQDENRNPRASPVSPRCSAEPVS